MIVSPSKDLNAWADGRNVVVTERMMRFAPGDDELAFVVAHEMAHNLLGHAALLRASAASYGHHGKMAGERARQFEIEADSLGLTLLTSARFDLQAAAGLIGRAMQRRTKSHTHPSAVVRLGALRDALHRRPARLL